MKVALNVLVIDDDEDDYFITSGYLKEVEDFTVSCTWCFNIQQAMQDLLSNKYDAYFLDFRLGAKTGLELLTEAIQQGCYKPIILLTGKGTPDTDKQAIRSGAYDYLVKGELSTEKIERCLRYSYERFKSFSKIQEDEKKYRHIFQNALSFIFICDTTMKILDCNQASEFLMGYPPDELKGRIFGELLEEEFSDMVELTMASKQNVLHLRVRLKTRNGEIKTGKLSMNYFDPGDGTVRWQGIMYDETIPLQLENAKVQYEKQEATHRLVRMLAHEIRNPLTNINLSLEGIYDVGLNEEQKSYYDIVKRNSHRINNIISELLDTSRSVNIDTETVDLNELIGEALNIAQDRILLQKINVQVILLPHPVLKKIDTHKFLIALLNLIMNAIEAMDKEEKKLIIELLQVNEQIMIQVRDNGCGISEENSKKLFEPYFTTKKTGMGLGLVATYNIIKSHNATVEVESQLGEGTTFRIIFF